MVRYIQTSSAIGVLFMTKKLKLYDPLSQSPEDCLSLLLIRLSQISQGLEDLSQALWHSELAQGCTPSDRATVQSVSHTVNRWATELMAYSTLQISSSDSDTTGI